MSEQKQFGLPKGKKNSDDEKPDKNNTAKKIDEQNETKVEDDIEVRDGDSGFGRPKPIPDKTEKSSSSAINKLKEENFHSEN